MSFKVDFGSVGSAIPVTMTETVTPLQVDMDKTTVIKVEKPPDAPVMYTHTFAISDWTPFATRWQVSIPATLHKLTDAYVVSVESYAAGIYDGVHLNVRRLANGDILLRADERFAGAAHLQKIY